MAADPVFIDTNVLIYATRRTASERAAAQAALARLEGEGSSLWISFQILRECLAAVTRPQATSLALPTRTAIADVRRFKQVFDIAEDRPVVLDRLLPCSAVIMVRAVRYMTEHRRNHAGAWHLSPADVQLSRFQALHRDHPARAATMIVCSSMRGP